MEAASLLASSLSSPREGASLLGSSELFESCVIVLICRVVYKVFDVLGEHSVQWLIH
jgi:hypothetical protein